MFSNWFPVDKGTTALFSISHVGRNFDNLRGMGFSSNKIILLGSGRQSKPTLWLLNTFPGRCEIALSPTKIAFLSYVSYLSSMAAAVHRALGDDCTDREQKRKMALAGKDFHSGFSNLRIVWGGSDVVGIITKIFFTHCFPFQAYSPLLFPSLWWTWLWDKDITAREIQKSGLTMQSHVLWSWKTEALANDELEGLATSSKKMFCCVSFTKMPREYLKIELEDLDLCFNILKSVLFLTLAILRQSW